jgi:hypothetical protein
MAGHSKIRVTLMVSVFALLAVAAGALASTRSTTTDLPPNTTKHATVECPAGTQVKSFGYEGKFDPKGETEQEMPTTLVRPKAASKVVAAAANVGPVAGSFRTFARCGREPSLERVKGGDLLAPEEQRSVVAKCPRGTSVRLAGFTANVGTSGKFVAINGLERESARRLKVSALNTGTLTGQLAAYAYCAHGSPSVHAVKKTLNLADGQERTAVARCPHGEKLLMGGLEVQHYASGNGDIYVIGMKPAGRRGWSVTGQKLFTRIGHLTSIAYCR